MRTTEIKIYQFSELSEAAKERAHDDYLSEGDTYGWHHEQRQSIEAFYKEFSDLIGCRREYTSPQQVASYRGYNDEIFELSGVRARTYFLNNYGHVLTESKTIRKGWKGKERRSRVQYVDTCCPFTGVSMDENILEPLRAFIAKPDSCKDVWDILTDCVHSWEKGYNQDMEHSQTLEYFAYMCEANNWEFTEDGKFYS